MTHAATLTEQPRPAHQPLFIVRDDQGAVELSGEVSPKVHTYPTNADAATAVLEYLQDDLYQLAADITAAIEANESETFLEALTQDGLGLDITNGIELVLEQPDGTLIDEAGMPVKISD